VTTHDCVANPIVRVQPARDDGASKLETQGASEVPYHYAAIAPGYALVLTAGACPLDTAGRVVGQGNVRRQMRQALRT
jgi:enamine deaminase RidA (YjgF/YER057c/UK114 family)